MSPAPGLLDTLAKNWWLLLLRGIAGVVFGVAAFVWPGVTLLVLVLLYGAYAFVDGVFAIAAAIAGRGGRATPTGWLAFAGVLGIAAGLAAFLWPSITALALLILIGVWSLLHGILEIVGAIRLRREIEGEFLLILGGLVSVAFGLFVLARPGAGALAVVWLIAAYAVVFGALLIALSLRLRGRRPRHA
ncbi:MAG: hypothetical protein DCC71_17650 [Proteobacteria bacterium]|nr:MAG: hypothetical protein DCC71_17650 [Pseudomonadota bacterium]